MHAHAHTCPPPSHTHTQIFLLYTCSSTPLTADDHAGLLVQVKVKRRIELPSDDSESEVPPASSSGPKWDCPGTIDLEDMKVGGGRVCVFNIVMIYIQGAPDITVLLTCRPHVYLVVGEVS